MKMRGAKCDLDSKIDFNYFYEPTKVDSASKIVNLPFLKQFVGKLRTISRASIGPDN
jgi:hypothetical protein